MHGSNQLGEMLTDGGTIPTGSWTEKGDGMTPTKEWDITDDRVTD